MGKDGQVLPQGRKSRATSSCGVSGFGCIYALSLGARAPADTTSLGSESLPAKQPPFPSPRASSSDVKKGFILSLPAPIPSPYGTAVTSAQKLGSSLGNTLCTPPPSLHRSCEPKSSIFLQPWSVNSSARHLFQEHPYP